MPFTIPNTADAAFAHQAAPSATDIAILQDGIKGNGVVTGCAVTAQGSPDMTVAVAAGTIRIAAVDVAVTAGNVTITAANATNPRTDLVVVNNSGTKSVTAGTAAAVPVPPAIPATSIVLAMVYVPANDTAIGSTQITDKRVELHTLTSLTGTFAEYGAGVFNTPALYKGMTFFISDLNGGALVRSNGSAWVSVAPPNVVLTTKGDIMVSSGSNVHTRLAVGTTPGRVLLPDTGATTGLAWTTNPYIGSLRVGVSQENAPRAQAASATVVAGTTGQLRMVGIWLPKDLVVTTLNFVVGSTAGVTITHSWVALYDSALALLRQSTDNTGQTLPASTLIAANLSSTFTTTYAGLHYFGIMVTAATMPTLIGFAGSAVLNAFTPIPSGTSTGSLTDTAPSTAAALTAVGGVPWVTVS